VQENLIGKLLGSLSDHQLDFTSTFRKLADQLITDNIILDQALLPFFNEWKNELVQSGLNLTHVNQQMNSINPCYIPRNHYVEKAIDLAYQNDFSFLLKLHNILTDPFIEKKKIVFMRNLPLHRKLLPTLSAEHNMRKELFAILLLNFICTQCFASSSKMADSINQFTLDVGKYLSKTNPDQNAFLSPLSISSALSMVAVGAKGSTLKEMQKTLKLSANTT